MTVSRYSLAALYPEPQRLRFGSLLHAMLTDGSPDNLRLLAVFDDLIQTAAERDWLDIEAWGRLRSGDDAGVLSILDELMLAGMFDRAGYWLVLHPPGSGGRVGEFLVGRDETPLFVEVKSLLPAESLVLMQTTMARLRDLAGAIPLGAELTIEIDHHPNSGINHKEVRRYLQVSAEQLLAGGPRPPAYTHTSGLYLRAVAVRAKHTPHLTLVEHLEEWPEAAATSQRLWRDRLWRAIRGGYTQLPHDGPASLIVVVDHTRPPPASEEWLAPIQEMLRMGSHRYLSGVVRLLADDLRAGAYGQTIFINPNALVACPPAPLINGLERRITMISDQ